jgi:hypothetical protein
LVSVCGALCWACANAADFAPGQMLKAIGIHEIQKITGIRFGR